MGILTLQEAADLLDYESIDEMPNKVATIFLPAVDNFIKDATGKDWGVITDTYTSIDATAKMVAGALLVRWFEDPGSVGKLNQNDFLVGLIGQLHAKVLEGCP